MSHPKRGLKALGLSLLAALGLMAFVAVGAQAANGWLVLTAGTNIAANESLKVAKHTEGNLLVKAQNLEILCSTVASDGLELIAGTSTAKGAINFTGCKTFQNGNLSNVCKPVEPILAGGKAKMILHPVGEGNRNYVLFEPTTAGGVFTIVKFGGLCALPKENEVKGTLVAECRNSGTLEAINCATLQATQLLQSAPAALFEEDKLKFGENDALLDGIAAVSLSGGHAGQPFGGHI